MWNDVAPTVDERARAMINLMAEIDYYEWYTSRKFINDGIVTIINQDIQLYQLDEDVLGKALMNFWIEPLGEDSYLLTDIGMIEAVVEPESIRWIQSIF